MFLAKSYCDIGNSQSSSSIVAPDGEITTTFEYDCIQRLVRVTDTEGNVTPPFTYDPLGNVLTKQTANMAALGVMLLARGPSFFAKEKILSNSKSEKLA